jgi:predicted PurR-regulated permease PerM
MLYKVQLEDENKNKTIKKIFTYLFITILIIASGYLIYPNIIKTESKNVELKPITSSDSNSNASPNQNPNQNPNSNPSSNSNQNLNSSSSSSQSSSFSSDQILN